MTLSRARIVGVAAAASVGFAAVIGAGVFAWHAVGPGSLASAEFPGINDPQLVAVGNSLLADVSTPTGARRDPFGTACGIGEVSLCMTSDSLSSRDLLDAAVDELRRREATVERRWCEEPQCLVHLDFQGAPMLLIVDETAASYGPASVTGGVMTNQEEPLPAAPLGSWESLSAAPTAWKSPKCVEREAKGCLRYQGVHSVEGAADSLAALRDALMAGAYRIDQDTCPPAGAIDTSCAITARRFRTLGGLDRMTAQFEFRATQGTGFEVAMSAWPSD